MSESNENVIGFIASTVEKLRDDVATMRAQMATKDDLAKIDGRLSERLDAVTADVATMQAGMTTMQAGMTTMQAGMTKMQAGMTTMQAEMATMQAEMATMQAEMATIRGEMATMRGEMATRAEVTAIRGEIATMRERMATREEVATIRREMAMMREDMAMSGDEMATMREQMATKEDLAKLDGRFTERLRTSTTGIRGDIEQIQLRLDSMEHGIASRFENVAGEISRLRGAVYILGKDRPEVLRLLGQFS